MCLEGLTGDGGPTSVLAPHWGWELGRVTGVKRRWKNSEDLYMKRSSSIPTLEPWCQELPATGCSTTDQTKTNQPMTGGDFYKDSEACFQGNSHSSRGNLAQSHLIPAFEKSQHDIQTIHPQLKPATQHVLHTHPVS